MPHEGAPDSGENLAQQNQTPEAYYGGEVPEFNPDQAAELRQQVTEVGESAGSDQAVETLETNESVETLEPNASVEVTETSETQEIPSVATAQDRLTLNRDTYNDLARRHAFIKSQYPDLQNAPKSIADEYANCSLMMTYLSDGVTAHLHGPMLVDPVGGKRVVVDAFSQDKFNQAARNLTDLASENASLLDAEAERNFQLPKIDVEAYAERIEQAATPEEFDQVRQEILAAHENADMDTLFALRGLSKDMNNKAREFHGADVSSEYAQLQEKVKNAEAALQQARDEWKKTNPFKKLGLRLSGKAPDFTGLQDTLKSARTAAEHYYTQNSVFLKTEQPEE